MSEPKKCMMAVKEDVLLSLRKHKVHPRESDSDCLKRVLSLCVKGV